MSFDPEVMASWEANRVEEREARWNFELTEDSLVYDFGGYTGEWAAKLITRHNPHVYIFEPVGQFCAGLVQRFKGNPKVSVFGIGISDGHGLGSIFVNKSSSSTFLPSSTVEKIWLADVASLPTPDMVSINIEGEEYRVLSRALETGWAQKVRHIQVQFHDFYPDCNRLRNEIREKLSETHYEVYNYPFVWEAWSRK